MDMNICDMERVLDRIRSSSCMSDDARKAAEYANDLLRVFRQFANLEWNEPASSLYQHAQEISSELDKARQ